MPRGKRAAPKKVEDDAEPQEAPEVPEKAPERTKRGAAKKAEEAMKAQEADKAPEKAKRGKRGGATAKKSEDEAKPDESEKASEEKEPAKKRAKRGGGKKSKEEPKPDSEEEEKDEGSEEEPQAASTIYDFKANDINGKEVSLDKYKGNVCIIVNVASKCGHTKVNYEQLVELYDKYSKDKGLRILAFPCNQFGKQEPGDAAKICEFTSKKNVKFDVFDKVNVNGKDAHPLWKFLTEKIEGPKGQNITWNFTKFIIDAEGVPVERHQPTVKPQELLDSLEKLW